MLGVVGRIKINYIVENKEYTDIVDISKEENFSLIGAPEVVFKVEEIDYIEDTIYGVTLIIVSPIIEDNEFFVSGNEPILFSIESTHIKGTLNLCFFN